MLVYVLVFERCFCMALPEIWLTVTYYVCLYCLFLFLGEILWLCYTFEGEFTYDVNNSVMSFGFLLDNNGLIYRCCKIVSVRTFINQVLKFFSFLFFG